MKWLACHFKPCFLDFWCLLAIAQVKGWLHPLPCHNVERSLSLTQQVQWSKRAFYCFCLPDFLNLKPLWVRVCLILCVCVCPSACVGSQMLCPLSPFLSLMPFSKCIYNAQKALFIFSHQMTIQMFHCSTHITPQKEKLWLTFKRDFSAINLKYYECCIEVNMNILDFVFNVPV